MGSLNKILITSLTALALTAGVSNAGEGQSGFSIGVTGSQSTFDVTGFEEEGRVNLTDREINSGNNSDSADYGAIFAEYTWNGGGMGAMTLGLELIPGTAEIGANTRTDITTDANEANQDDKTYTAKAEVEDHITLYIEPTINFNDYISGYVQGGISYVEVNSLEDLASGTDSSSYGNKEIFGAMFGVGVKMSTPFGLFAKLGVQQTEYQSFELESTGGNQNIIHAEPEQTSARLSLGFNF